MHAQLLCHVWLFVTPWTIACQAPLFVKFFRARILEWVAISSSKGSSQPRDWTHESCIGRWILYTSITWEAFLICANREISPVLRKVRMLIVVNILPLYQGGLDYFLSLFEPLMQNRNQNNNQHLLHFSPFKNKSYKNILIKCCLFS